MAGEKNSKSATASPRTPGGRTTPVLVPQGSLAGQPDVPLDRPVTTVGSNENARLHLVSRTVSKGHAIFVNSGGATYVADMASRTGVLVNGKLVKDAELKTGDRIQIGKFVFRFRSPANVAPSVPRPQSPSAAVIVVGSPAVPAKGRTVIIGRRETSDIAIPGDAGVSSAHAVIFQMDGSWFIRDLGSRSGTKVNGSAIHQYQLKFGDRISVGSTNVLFQPGSAKQTRLEDSTAPNIPLDLSDELGTEEMPVEAASDMPAEDASGFVPDAGGEPEPVEVVDPIPAEASEEDDAIPLGDWRAGIEAEPLESSAEPASDSAAENDAPLELEPEPEPAPEPVEAAAADFDVVDPLSEKFEPTDSVAAEDEEFALVDEVPAASARIKPEPVEAAAAHESAGEFQLADEAVPLAAEPAEHVEPVVQAVKAGPADAEVEFAVEPEPAPPVDVPKQAADPVAAAKSEAAPIRAVEPAAKPAAIEIAESELPIYEEAVAVPVAETSVPVSPPMPAPVPVVAPSKAMQAEAPVTAVAPSKAMPAEAPVIAPAEAAKAPAAAPVSPPPAPLPVMAAPAPAKAPPPPRPPPPPPIEHLLGEVEEFVFVPTEERVDPNAVPDVIFWGDPDLDSATEQVVTSAAPAVPPAPQKKQPPADSEGDSSDDEGPSGPPAGPSSPVLPPDSNGTAPEPVHGEAKQSAAHDHTANSAASQMVPAHHGEPAVALHAADMTRVDLPSPIAVDVRIEPAGSDAVEAGEVTAANVDAVHVEADHVPAVPEAPGELVESIIDDRDDFFTPLSPELAAAFAAARALNENLAREDVAPFEVIAPFEPAAQGTWQAEPSTLAVQVLEPQEAAHAGDVDAEAFDLDLHEPVANLVPPVLGELDQTDVEASPTSGQVPAVSDHAVDFPVVNSTAAAIESTVHSSAALNADLIEPVFSTTAAEDAAMASSALDLPEITAASSTDWSATINVDLDAPITVEASTQAESVASVGELDLPQIEATAAEHSPALVGQLSADVVEFNPSDSGGELPDFEKVDAELSTETVEFQPTVSSDEQIEFTESASGPSITETPATTDFAGHVSANVDDVVDVPVEPAEETITLSEDQAVAAAADGVVASDAADESDLEFLDFDDSPAEAAAESPSPVEPPVAPAPVAQTPKAEPEASQTAPESPEDAPEKSSAPAAPRKGPSLFGFDFEGGSFLGGMPISLADKSAIPKPPAPARSPAFDAKATAPSGLGSMAAAIVPPGRGPVAATPPRPSARPTVPPPVARSPGGGASVSGLISDALPQSAPPTIPPVVKSIAGNTAAAGAGLTGTISTAGMASRSVDVFSQQSGPIGVEVFGGRAVNPEQITIPDITETTSLEPVETEPQADEQVTPPVPALVDASATAPVRNVRWWRIPLWLSMAIVIIGGSWAVVPLVVHESSSFVGSLSFAGLKQQNQQQPVEYHDFIESQKSLLLGARSEEIRLGAKAILLKDGHPPGFTADPKSFADAVQTQDFVFADDHVDFELHWPDPVMARAQVDAVLLALAEKDQDLVDAKHKALIAADDAKAKLDAINAERAKLKTEYDIQAEKASEKPDLLSVSQNQQDVTSLTEKFNSAHALRVASESILAEVKAQDPSKPVDPDSDKEIVELKRRLDLLNEQIRLARSKGGVNAASASGVGTDVGVGATTQPDATADPLLKAMQEQADNWSGKIQRRRDELAALAAIPADQRAVNQAAAIENLSIKITNLQKSEDDLKKQLDAARLTQAEFQKRISDANLAAVHQNELYAQIQNKDAERQAAAETAAKLETAYENSVTVAGQSPARFISVTNLRKTIATVISILALIVFGRLTWGELLRPRIITSPRPAAAPLANPPMRVVPWPQPHQLQGLKSDGA